MRISGCWLRKQIAFGLAVFLAMPLAEAVAAPSQQSPSEKQAQGEPALQSPSQASDSRAVKANPDTSQPDAIQGGQTATSQPASEQEQNSAQKPVGSAAAPYEKTTGVAASRPAGAVIAPAKQRRARSFLIRVSIVVGAAVAIGTVVALSHGSPSRPN